MIVSQAWTTLSARVKAAIAKKCSVCQRAACEDQRDMCTACRLDTEARDALCTRCRFLAAEPGTVLCVGCQSAMNAQVYADLGASGSNNDDSFVLINSPRALAAASVVNNNNNNLSDSDSNLASACTIERSELDLGAVISSDSATRTFRASFHQVEVAVRTAASEQGDSLLRRELALLSSLHHPHIVQCLGYCADPLCVVLEHCGGGSLAHAIQVKSLPAERHLPLMRQVASALVYLHTRRPVAVVHRALRPDCILLEGAGERAKLADFCAAGSAAPPAGVEPTLHSAPEVCSRRAEGNQAELQDVYSYAVVLWEVLAQRLYTCSGPVVEWTLSGQRPSLDRRLPPWTLQAGLHKLLQQCWSAEPGTRPAMQQVLGALDAAHASSEGAAQRSQKDEHDDDDDDGEQRLCVVCLDRPKTHVLVPCGHVCVCADHCNVRLCPLCRGAVASSHHVYL